MNKIAILMATYNAGNFIIEQLDSIYDQTYNDFDLYIHDDGSTDDTISIIRQYQKKQDNIYLIEDGIKFHSASKNFFHLIKYIKKKEYEYICFSDQDDIWEKNHIEVLLNELKVMPKDIPCLVHGDAKIIDINNNIINDSFNTYGNIKMERTDFLSISLKNNCQGTSMMINKTALKYIYDSTDEINIYDSYLSCVTSLYGNQKFINMPILRYRQHDKNVVGGQKSRKLISMFSFKNFNLYKKVVNDSLNKIKAQLKYMQNYDKNNKEIEKTIKFIDSNFMYKFVFIIRNNLICKRGLKSSIGLLLYKNKRVEK